MKTSVPGHACLQLLSLLPFYENLVKSTGRKGTTKGGEHGKGIEREIEKKRNTKREKEKKVTLALSVYSCSLLRLELKNAKAVQRTDVYCLMAGVR